MASDCALWPNMIRNRPSHARLVVGLWCICILFVVLVTSSPAAAQNVIIIGDSIGQDLARTVGLKTVARTSFSLRRHDVRAQLQLVPQGMIGVLSLGLNDAADPVTHLKPFVERAIRHIEATKRPLVWIGPPCVLKRWDAAAKRLDAFLSVRLKATNIQYVSLRDDAICSRRMRTGDGQHFTPSGYRYLWKKIRAGAPLLAGAPTQ